MKKGFLETGVAVVMVVVVAAMGIAGAGAFSSNPTTLGFSSAVLGLTAYSQTNHVKRDFRERKAVAEFGVTEADAQALNDSDLLALIRDDKPNMHTGGNQGNFVNGYMY